MRSHARSSAPLALALSLALLAGGCAAMREPLVLTPQEQASTPELWPGDPAPPIAASEWVKGEPVPRFEPGTVYVLDFWAVWCGPCIASMPRTSRMADEHAGRVVVIAMTSVDTANTPRAIRDTVRRRDGQMRFRVAIDDGSRMSDAYRRAAREPALPRSFIIDGAGRLAWIGHPVFAEPVLESILAGTWDPAAAAEARRAARLQAAERARLEETCRLAYRSGDHAAELEAFEQLCAMPLRIDRGPPMHMDFAGKVQVLKKMGRPDEALQAARQCAAIEAFRDDVWMHAHLADLTLELDAPFAGALADRAAALLKEESQNPGDEWDQYMREHLSRTVVYEHLAAVRPRQGRPAEAAALQQVVVDRLPAHIFTDDAARAQSKLEKYQQAAAEVQAGAGGAQ